MSFTALAIINIYDSYGSEQVSNDFLDRETSPNKFYFVMLLSDMGVIGGCVINPMFSLSVAVLNHSFPILVPSEVEVTALNMDEARSFIRTYRSSFVKTRAMQRLRIILDLGLNLMVSTGLSPQLLVWPTMFPKMYRSCGVD